MKYKVANFSSKTPVAEQTKLKTSLKAIRGVESVKLHPERSEITISNGDAPEPKREVISAAVQRAGFSLTA